MYKRQVMAKGRGLQLISLSDGVKLEHVAVTGAAEFVVESIGKRGALHQEKLRIQDINNKRGRKGRVLEISGRLKRLSGADSV